MDTSAKSTAISQLKKKLTRSSLTTEPANVGPSCPLSDSEILAVELDIEAKAFELQKKGIE